MYVSKFYTLAASAVLQLAAGAAYTFSLYAPSLKTRLQLSQPQLEGVGSALLSGGLFAWAPGFVYDSLVPYHKLGPRLSGLIGVLFHFCGYFMIWAGASGMLSLPYWVLVASGLLASNSLLWLDTTAIVTSMRNFPGERGSIAGILKTFLGLSASILTTIYGAAFTPDGIKFLLFLAIGPAALGLLVLPFLNFVPHMEHNEIKRRASWLATGQRLLAVAGIVAFLLIYQLLTALAGQIWGLSQAVKTAILSIALALVLVTLSAFVGGVTLASRPVSLPDQPVERSTNRSELTPKRRRREENAASHEDRLPEQSYLIARRRSGEVTSQTLEEGEDESSFIDLRQYTLPQCLVSLDYWILWSAMYIGIGSGFVFINNLGQHVEALGGKQGSQEVYVLLFATFNCLGRMVCGFGSEWLLHRYAVPRTVVLLSMSASSAVAYALIGFAGLRALLPLAILAGTVFGAHWALMPSCTSELFGATHFAANQSIIHLATALGALTLSTWLAGNLYQHKGTVHGDPRGTCYGADCFRGSFWILAACSLVQSVLSILLNARNKLLYKRICIDVRRYRAGTGT